MSKCHQTDTLEGLPCSGPVSGANDRGCEFTAEGGGGDVTLGLRPKELALEGRAESRHHLCI